MLIEGQVLSCQSLLAIAAIDLTSSAQVSNEVLSFNCSRRVYLTVSRGKMSRGILNDECSVSVAPERKLDKGSSLLLSAIASLKLLCDAISLQEP